MKNKFTKILVIFLFSLFVLDVVFAFPSGRIGLLTVSESKSNSSVERGGVADLYLEIRPGTGRIFIDSFPISKIDTQITTRFANEIACDFLNKDCSTYDFFYTIIANSAIVGGPSAGAAATVLTVAVLDEQLLDEKTVMTGTINSGNLIGPVSGIYPKVLAAQQKGYETVIIPKWDSPDVNKVIENAVFNKTIYSNDSNPFNESVYSSEAFSNLTIDVVEVSTLEDALFYFTHKNYSKSSNDLLNSQEYDSIMKQVTIDLCTKYGSFDSGKIIMPNLSKYVNVTNSSDNFVQALDAINNDAYYSAASFCFAGNLKITSKLLSNLSKDDLKIEYLKTFSQVNEFEKETDKKFSKLSTLSELETYMIVTERLHDAKDALSDINKENMSSDKIAYAKERLATAKIWTKFSSMSGKKFELDTEFLKNLCTKKLSEAEERVNYLELYFDKSDIREDLQKAYSNYYDKEYAQCIFLASKVKADSNVISSALFVDESKMDDLFNEKMIAAKNSIYRQQEKDIFPILGYSYYEYAKSLKNTSTYSALLYAEYSLELSNIEMYFKSKDPIIFSKSKDNSKIIYATIFTFGAVIGFLIGALTISSFKLKKKNSKEKFSKKNSKK